MLQYAYKIGGDNICLVFDCSERVQVGSLKMTLQKSLHLKNYSQSHQPGKKGPSTPFWKCAVIHKNCECWQSKSKQCKTTGAEQCRDHPWNDLTRFLSMLSKSTGLNSKNISQHEKISSMQRWTGQKWHKVLLSTPICFSAFIKGKAPALSQAK